MSYEYYKEDLHEQFTNFQQRQVWRDKDSRGEWHGAVLRKGYRSCFGICRPEESDYSALQRKWGGDLPLIDSMGREQQAKFINEGNVYRLIAHSKLPAAEQFERWVFDEVLPTIRRNGAYMTDDTLEHALTSPDFLIQLATKLKEEKQSE